MRTSLILAEAKLQFQQDLVVARQDELKDEISTMQYWLNMGEQKIQGILGKNNSKMHQKIIESLKHDWKTWSTQATELQLLRADHYRFFPRWMRPSL